MSEEKNTSPELTPSAAEPKAPKKLQPRVAEKPPVKVAAPVEAPVVEASVAEAPAAKKSTDKKLAVKKPAVQPGFEVVDMLADRRLTGVQQFGERHLGIQALCRDGINDRLHIRP